MAEAKIQTELKQSRQEISRLRERLTTGLTAVHNDLFHISLVPKCQDHSQVYSLRNF
jgi:hypothetical protein